MTVIYLPGKDNLVVVSLRQMTIGSVSHVEEERKERLKNVHRLACFGVQLENSPNSAFMVHHNSDSSLVVVVKPMQHLDPLLMELKESILGKLNDHNPKWG